MLERPLPDAQNNLMTELGVGIQLARGGGCEIQGRE